MTNIINVNRSKDLHVMDYAKDQFAKGTYRVITKCQAGFMISSDLEANSPYEVFCHYNKKAIQSISYVTGLGPLMVYARVGKKVWIAKDMLSQLEVGDINQSLSDTALYSQEQYKAVNAKSWASKAYVMNGSFEFSEAEAELV